MVMVQCTGGELTFDILVDFETVATGSTATGIVIAGAHEPQQVHALLVIHI